VESRINRIPLRPAFRQFTLLCRELNLFGRELLAVDGTRIKAVNNKDRNFTKNSNGGPHWDLQVLKRRNDKIRNNVERPRNTRTGLSNPTKTD
jgi:hypothetical protein